MPLSVAESLRQGHSVEAMEFSEATILFTDIVTFTNICAKCSPYDVVNMLNNLYLRFDKLVNMVGKNFLIILFKIKNNIVIIF